MTNPTHLNLVNVSLRLYQVHRELLERAAALVPGRTISDYMREVLPMQAALDLNVELPHTPDIHRGRGGSIVAQAAAKLGMTREEFEAQAARAMAAQTLGADVIDERPSRELAQRHDSAMRPVARPGGYSQTNAPRRQAGKR